MADQKFDPLAVLPGTRIGPYHVLECIGRGGMGAVYRVERDGMPFALKLSPQRQDDLNGDERAALETRVRREVAALAALHHPNVVRIHGFDSYPDMHGSLYLVMDFVEGLRLYAWQDTHRPSLRAVATVFLRVADALQALHARGIRHRDIKSDNVLVRADGEPILIDFGIARAEGGGGPTRAGYLVGTPTHVSPEYARHLTSPDDSKGKRHTFGPTDDLHALGVMLYQALTGRPPFSRKANHWDLLKDIAHRVPERPRTANPLVPESLDAITMKLLAKHPAPKVSTQNGRVPAPHAGPEAPDAFRELLFDAPPAPAPAPPPNPQELTARLEFRAPTSPHQRFEAPEAAPHGGGTAASSPGGELPTAIRAMGQHLAKQSTPRRASVLLGASAVAGAVLMAAVLATLPREEPQRPRTLLQEHTRAEPSEPLPAPLVSSAAPVAPILPAPRAVPEAQPRAPLPVQVDVREPARRPAPPRRSPASQATSRRAAEDDTPSWLKGAVVDESPPPTAPTPAKLGVPLGAHIRVRLKSDLDSRAMGEGLVEAVLVHSHVVRSQSVLPAWTRVYGRAQVSGDRFDVQFSRLRLPNGTELAIKGTALDEDGRPGLAARRRIRRDAPAQPDVPEALVRTAAGVLLGQVSGHPAADVAGAAGRQVLEGKGVAAGQVQEAVLLDAETDFQVVVQEAF